MGFIGLPFWPTSTYYLGLSENNEPLNPMVNDQIFLLNGYFIGNINPTFSDKPKSTVGLEPLKVVTRVKYHPAKLDSRLIHLLFNYSNSRITQLAAQLPLPWPGRPCGPVRPAPALHAKASGAVPRGKRTTGGFFVPWEKNHGKPIEKHGKTWKNTFFLNGKTYKKLGTHFF